MKVTINNGYVIIVENDSGASYETAIRIPEGYTPTQALERFATEETVKAKRCLTMAKRARAAKKKL